MSRTKNSLRNVKYGITFFILNILVNLFSRGVFISNLGIELLGMNQAIVNIVGFLSLTELGIAVAIASSLYTPLLKGDKEQVIDLISIQGWMYRNIAFIVLSVAFLISLFFPKIFNGISFPLWYAYATFFIMVAGIIAEYTFTYRKIIFTANQQDFRVQRVVKTGQISKVALQTLCIYLFEQGYLYWLLIELINVIAINSILTYQVRKAHPDLLSTIKRGRAVRKKYPEIIRKTKQLFFHKVTGFILMQATPLIVLYYTSLEMMGIYSNYMFVMTAIFSFMWMLNNAVQASVGNMIAENNQEKIIKFYWKYHAITYYLASVICFGFYLCINPFITLWVGSEYTIEGTPIILMTIYVALMTTRCNEVFLSAKGMFYDIYAPIIEGLINLTLSIILGYYFGLTGVLIGVCTSLFLVVFIWKGTFLFKFGFNKIVLSYFITSIKLCLLSISCFFVVLKSQQIMVIDNKEFILMNLFLNVVFSSIFVAVVYFFCSSEFKQVIVNQLLKHK